MTRGMVRTIAATVIGGVLVWGITRYLDRSLDGANQTGAQFYA